MTKLDDKLNEHFAGLVVRKDLVKTVKGNAIVPSYVLEYLLGQYCATNDEDSIQTGIETVKEILRKHYVHRNQAGLIRSHIREKGRYKVIDRISVALNDKRDVYEASFSNLGIKNILVDADTVKQHPKLLVSGVWCIADLEYQHTEDNNSVPWILSTLKPIQLSHFDFEHYLASREQFSTQEWIDLLIQSIGFNPEMLSERSKLTQLVRLIPFCERNYNLIELGPKGTGKSHIYSEFSPHGILISGGEVTVPKLFVNNSSGKIGLVGYWDTVAFDEFAGKQKRVDKALVDILKNYMANKSVSRGVETLGAEASMVFVGNTRHSVAYMLKHSDLFEELPEKYHDSAFLDRLHFYIPGWEVDIIRGEMFSDGYGFVVDYLAEILRSLRDHDYSDRYSEYFSLSSDISTRDRDSVHKTFSGLMKILFPSGQAPKDEVERLLRFAIEGRKRIKDQLLVIDPTYSEVTFAFEDLESGKATNVTTLEEDEYPGVYRSNQTQSAGTDDPGPDDGRPEPSSLPEGPKEKHLVIKENQRGISYRKLFTPYLEGATKITIHDPYIIQYYQAKNLMELLQLIMDLKPEGEEIQVQLVTKSDVDQCEKQEGHLDRIRNAFMGSGLQFDFEYSTDSTMHARSIQTDTGWKISLDRGLDIFQPYDMRDTFSLANQNQEARACKTFEVSFLMVD
jgi:ATP-dependent Lon protease